MGELYLRTMIVTMLVAMTCVMPATAHTPDLLPPKIVPARSSIGRQHFTATAKKHAHRKTVRHHRNRH